MQSNVFYYYHLLCVLQSLNLIVLLLDLEFQRFPLVGKGQPLFPGFKFDPNQGVAVSPEHVKDACVLLLDCFSLHQLQVGFVDFVLQEPYNTPCYLYLEEYKCFGTQFVILEYENINQENISPTIH